MVDNVSLPRDTVHRRAGDCDDLTALYATILETTGVETAFVTTPGHIYVGVNTTVPAAQHEKVHPDPSMVMLIDGETWVLVEITMLGTGDFMEAWTTGMREFQVYRDQPDKRGFYETRQAQQVYRPVGLRSSDRTIDLTEPQEMAELFVEDRDQLAGVLLGDFRERAEQRDRGRDWQRYGILAARFEQFDEAERAFTRAGQARDGSPVEAQVNIGSMYYLQERYQDAVRAFTEAQRLADAATDRGEGVPRRSEIKLLLNLSRTYYELNQFEQAQEVYEQATRLDADTAREYSYLAQVAADEGSRAAEAGRNDILFVGEE
jgi:tetratricopeptide (TPR) repeat protein